MTQRRDGARFAFKALFCFRVLRYLRAQDFDCNTTVQSRVPGVIHLAHAARAEVGLDFVGTEFRSGSEWHSCAPL